MAVSTHQAKKKLSVSKKSFVEAVKEKYCTDLDSFSIGNGFVIKYIQGKPKDDKKNAAELAFLRNVGLSNSSISHGGIPEEGLMRLCPNIVDLDLSHNLIDNWSDVLELLSALPSLKFINLSHNKVFNDKRCISAWKRPLSNVEDVVLNSTELEWCHVIALTSVMPALKELHVCGNGYTDLVVQSDDLHTVECLRINDNSLTSWEEIWKLHQLPKLKTLILSGNPLQDIFYKDPMSEVDTCNCPWCRWDHSTGLEDLVFEVEEEDLENDSGHAANVNVGSESATGDQLVDCKPCGLESISWSNPFPALKALCISETSINAWQHVEELSKFPHLHSVRMKGIQLLSTADVTEEDRRKLSIACLPTISNLNGSSISETERDKAERHCLTYFSDKESKPAVFQVLQEKHGQLTPLADVDIGYGFQEWAKLKFIHKANIVHEANMHVVEPVGTLRLYISKKLFLPLRSFRMWHRASGASHKEGLMEDLEELFLDSLPMSRFNFLDGDEIFIDDI